MNNAHTPAQDLLVKNLNRYKQAKKAEAKSRQVAASAASAASLTGPTGAQGSPAAAAAVGDTSEPLDLIPTTFVLPQDHFLFVEEFHRQGGTWIMKPSAAAQGKGIFLVHRLSQVSCGPSPHLESTYKTAWV